MYLHPLHRLHDREAAFDLMGAQPLGAWVIAGPNGLVANHVPFLLDRRRGPHGSLLGHVSRANAVWRGLDAATPSIVMFQGPQAYVTPGWYPGHTTHGEVVPTWNYLVVHAHGVARAFDDRDALLDLLGRLTDVHEAPQATPWRIANAPADYIDRTLRAIVGIEIPIERLEAKLKASQDEALPDRMGTVQGLRGSGCPAARAMADWVAQAIDTDAQDDPARG